MRSTRLIFFGWLGTTALSLGACLSEPVGDGATGGTGAGGTDPVGGSGGSVVTGGTGAATGGTTPTGGLGGSVSTGGAVGSGGTAGGSGGTIAGAGGYESGGMTSTGGVGPAGTGGMGGMTGGGRGGAGNAGGTAGAGAVAGRGGSGGGSAGAGACVKGQTKGNQVVMIGESFIAATHQITRQVETRAKSAGALPQSERYIDNSVSGTTLANNQIGMQYDRAVSSSGNIKYVLMDGGGNDCLINNNGAAALTAATQLFQRMATNNTEKVVFFFYPDPIGNNFASLKSCLDTLRPQMKAICDGLTSPKCYWLDLRETWNGHNEYTEDGIHPSASGSAATGDAIWEVMVDNCVAQ